MIDTSQDRGLAPIGFNPLAPPRPHQRVGRLVVVGNDSCAWVYPWISMDYMIHCESNSHGCPDDQPPSAFLRCVEWALANQHGVHEDSLF